MEKIYTAVLQHNFWHKQMLFCDWPWVIYNGQNLCKIWDIWSTILNTTAAPNFVPNFSCTITCNCAFRLLLVWTMLHIISLCLVIHNTNIVTIPNKKGKLKILQNNVLVNGRRILFPGRLEVKLTEACSL